MIRREHRIRVLSAVVLAAMVTGPAPAAHAGRNEAAKPAEPSVEVPSSEMKVKKKKARKKPRAKWATARESGRNIPDGKRERIEDLGEVWRPGLLDAAKGSGLEAPKAVGTTVRRPEVEASRTPEVPGSRRRVGKPWDAPSVTGRIGEGSGGRRRAGAPWREWTASGGSQSWTEPGPGGSTRLVTVTPTPSGTHWRREETDTFGQRTVIVTDDPGVAYEGRPDDGSVAHGPEPDWNTESWIETGPNGERRLVQVTEVAPGRYERVETDPYGRKVVVITDDPEVAYAGRPGEETEGGVAGAPDMGGATGEGPFALSDPRAGGRSSASGDDDPEWSSATEDDYDWDDEFADEEEDGSGSGSASSGDSGDDGSGGSSSGEAGDEGESDEADDADSESGETETETAGMPAPECGEGGPAYDAGPAPGRSEGCGPREPTEQEKEQRKAKLRRTYVSQPDPEEEGRDSCPSRDPWTGECRRMGGRGGTVDPGSPEWGLERPLGPRRSLADVIEEATGPVTNPADR